MINIDGISCGWLTITIGNEEFVASYLTDVMQDVDYLIDLNDKDVKRIYLDGESSGEVILIAYKTFGEYKGKYMELINVVWDYYDRKKFMSFPYDKFKLRWEKVKEKVFDKYNKEFNYHNW